MTAVVRAGHAFEDRVGIVNARSFIVPKPEPFLQERSTGPPSELLRGKWLTKAVVSGEHSRGIKGLIARRAASGSGAVLGPILRIQVLYRRYILVIGSRLINRLAKWHVGRSRRRIQRAGIGRSLGETGVGIHRDRRVCVQAVRVEEAKNAPVKVAGSTLRNDVDHAAISRPNCASGFA